MPRSTYYAHRASRAARTVRERAEEVLVGEIRVLHAGSRGAYGAPRIHAALRRAGRVVNSKKVERLMRKHRIVGITRRGGGPDPAGEAGGVRARPDRPGLHRAPARDAARRRHD
ncbi:IS3 family transposase [Streptomyces kaempferi]